jgi:hypothetical protein
MRIVARKRIADVPPQRWRNGGGWTRQLLTWPPDDTAWQLRISLATISAPGPFSSFPGVQRTLALVGGKGLLLTVDGQEHRLRVDSDPLQFDGAAAAHATLPGGETTDLNLMTTRGQGTVLRVASAPQWCSAAPQRGLYAAVAGTLDSGTGAGMAMPAQSLVWLDEAAGLTLRFTPEAAAGPAEPLLAWWLCYAPAS